MNRELNLEIYKLKHEVAKLKYDEIQKDLEDAKGKHFVFTDNIFEQLAMIQEELDRISVLILNYNHNEGELLDISEGLIQTSVMCIQMLISFKLND